MKLPKSVPGVNRGMSALRGYNHQVGVEPLLTYRYFGPPSGQTCRWVGTAPFCAGQCAPGETEVGRAGTTDMVPFNANGAAFGSQCFSGTKAYCCKPK